MRKGIIISLLIITSLVFLLKAHASDLTPTMDPNELAVDNNCQSARLLGSSGSKLGGDWDLFGACSAVCPRKCLYASPEYTKPLIGNETGFCLDSGGGVYSCHTYTGVYNLNSSLGQQVDFFGIEVDRAPLVLIRRVLLLVFGGAGLLIVVLGMVATYKYSLAGGVQEKLQEAVKMFKSLIIGAVITFGGLVLIQLVATLTGVTGSLFDFNFLPRSGIVVYLYPDDLGRKCLPEQVTATDSQQQYVCDPSTLTWVTPTP